MINIKPEHYTNAIKIFIVMSLFFYIRKLNIPDNYKFLLTIVPSLLILTTTNVVNHFKYKNGNKPIVVRKDDNISDKYLSDEYFFTEGFNNNKGFDNNKGFNVTEGFTIETQTTSNAMIYEIEKPFWIQNGGYLDISNPYNFVKIDNLKLNNNYTLEFWLRLKYLSNNNLVLFNRNNKKLLEIKYDDKFITMNKNNKLPYKENEWFHLVIMRGKIDTIGSNVGSMYVNGIFYGYIENLPELGNMNESYLFKYEGDYVDYNKKYHDLSNCSIVRIYDRSLTLDEIQNNYLKDANYFGLENEDITGRIYVQDKSLVFYLESRTDSTPLEVVKEAQKIPSKSKIISAPPQKSVLFIDPILMTNNENPNVDKELMRLQKKRQEESQKVYLFDVENVSKSNRDWLVRASKSLLKEENKEKKTRDKTDSSIIVIDESKNKDEYIAQPDWISPEKSKNKPKEEVIKKDIKGEIVKQPKITEVKKEEKPKTEDKVEVKKLNTTKPIFK